MGNNQGVTLDRLRRTGLLLVWVGLLWNLVEAGVALWSGVKASSGALLGFGLDSLIELFAGSVLIWHLSREWKGEEENRASEERAHRLLGVTFFLLAAFILAQSIAILLGWLPQPDESITGIVLVVVSAVLMFGLYAGKTRIARSLGSRALRAEAVESLICDIQDLTLLVGLGLNAVVGWWWADPIAALLLIPWLVKEGREAFSEGDDH